MNRARQPNRVNAPMVTKAPIFNGDEGRRQMRWHVAQPHCLAIKITIGGKQFAICGKQRRGRPARGGQRHFRAWQIPSQDQQNH